MADIKKIVLSTIGDTYVSVVGCGIERYQAEYKESELSENEIAELAIKGRDFFDEYKESIFRTDHLRYPIGARREIVSMFLAGKDISKFISSSWNVNKQGFDVFIGIKPDISTSEARTVVLSPSRSKWNDFNYRPYFDIIISLGIGSVEIIPEAIKIIFEDESVDALYFKESSLPINISDFSIMFLSQVQNEKVYRRILSVFGGDKKATTDLLLQIHDAAISKSIDPQPDYLSLLNDYRLNLVLLRSAAAYYAFIRGIYCVTSEDEKNFDAAAVFNTPIKAKLSSKFGDYEITLDYVARDYFKPRMNIFVGKNGTGKSYSARKIVDILLNKNISQLVTNKIVSQRPGFNRILVISNTCDDEYCSTKKSVPYKWHKNSEYYYINTAESKKFDIQTGSNKFTTASAIHDILQRDWHENGYFEKKTLFIKVLQTVIDFDTIRIPSVISGDDYLLLSEFSGERKYLTNLSNIDKNKEIIFVKENISVELSSGQKAFARILCGVLSVIESNSLVIFEEPENFLHPNLECEFVSLIYKLLDLTNSVSIVITHSPVIVRESFSDFVTIFMRDTDGITTNRPQIETFGNNLHKLANYIFGDFGQLKEFDTIMRIMSEGVNKPEELFEKYGNSLNADVLMVLLNKYIIPRGPRA